MADYTSHNSHVFKDMLSQYAENTLATRIGTALKRVAEKMVETIEGAFEPFSYEGGGTDLFPVWEGQLHDATGVGVYVNGRLSSYIPTSRGRFAQKHKDDDNIIGTERLQTALNSATTTYSKGIWIVLFSAVPYAYEVDTEGSPWGRGIGFFEDMEKRLLNDVIKNLKPKKL